MGNNCFLWFARLLESQRKVIAAHATYSIISSKIERMNRKIKAVHRNVYGLSDARFLFHINMDLTHKASGQKAREKGLVMLHAKLERQMVVLKR